MEKEKLEKLKEITPSLWNSYQHMYDIRRTGIQNKTNFLLIVISLLSAISMALFTYFKNYLFLIPFSLQLTSFVILLKFFLIKEEFKVHWFKSEGLFKNLDNGHFYQDLFADIKALEDGTWIYITYVGKIIRISLSILLLSLYTLLLILIFVYFEGIILYFLALILIISSIVVFIYYKVQPKFKYELNYKKYREQVDGWITNEK